MSGFGLQREPPARWQGPRVSKMVFEGVECLRRGREEFPLAESAAPRPPPCRVSTVEYAVYHTESVWCTYYCVVRVQYRGSLTSQAAIRSHTLTSG